MNRTMTVKTLFLLLVMWMPLAVPCHASWDDYDDDFYDYYTYEEWDEEDEYDEEDWDDYDEDGTSIYGGTIPEVIVDGTDRSDEDEEDEEDDWWHTDTDGDSENIVDVENEQNSELEEDEPEHTNKEPSGYQTAEQVIQELKSQTPELKNLLDQLQKENRIHVHNGERTCYVQSSGFLFIGKGATHDMVLHETIHYLQDECGKLNYDKNSINNEYETQWLTYLTTYIEYGCGSFAELGLDEASFRTMRDLLEQNVDWETGTVTDGFYDIVAEYADGHENEFSVRLGSTDHNNAYTNSYDSNYDYDWKGMMNKLGY